MCYNLDLLPSGPGLATEQPSESNLMRCRMRQIVWSQRQRQIWKTHIAAMLRIQQASKLQAQPQVVCNMAWSLLRPTRKARRNELRRRDDSGVLVIVLVEHAWSRRGGNTVYRVQAKQGNRLIQRWMRAFRRS